VKRFFRFFGKKKGTRITGSRWWAGVGEIVFAAALCVMGMILLVALVTLQISRVTTGAQFYSIWQFALFLLLTALLLAIGGYRIWATWWRLGASVERRGAMVSRAREINLLNEMAVAEQAAPFLPVHLYTLVAPGWMHRFALKPIDPVSRHLIWSGVICLLFVGVTTVLLAFAWESWVHERMDWISLGLGLTMLVGAGGSIAVFLRHLLAQTGIGPTRIELSDYPLRPGQRAQLTLTQPARVRLRLFDVILQCIEEATYREGTDVRCESRVVYQRRLFRKRGQAVELAEPFSTDVDLEMPAGVMHSFQSHNNKIQWRIAVTCIATGWPRFERNFPLLVLPPKNGAAG
jgi:hypothetical protein